MIFSMFIWHNDSTDFIGVNDNRDVFVFVWNSDTLLYEKVFQTQMLDDFIPKTIYLLDVSADGRLDFVLWGVKTISEGQSLNSLAAYVRQIATTPEQLTEENIYIFKNTTMLTMPGTTDPIIIGYRFVPETDGVGFLLYMNGERVFLTYKEQ